LFLTKTMIGMPEGKRQLGDRVQENREERSRRHLLSHGWFIKKGVRRLDVQSLIGGRAVGGETHFNQADISSEGGFFCAEKDPKETQQGRKKR